MRIPYPDATYFADDNPLVEGLPHVIIASADPHPLLDPARCIAIALSLADKTSSGRIYSDNSPAVRLVLHSLKLAGWKIEAR
jgi:hypothetical protein